MNDVHALLLGLVQGVTEFFPISSSTHLHIVRNFFGIEEGPRSLLFDLFCHLGTVCAAFLFLRREVVQTFTSLRSFALVSLALAPLLPAYLLLKPFRVSLAPLAPVFLMISALLLFLAASRVEERVQSVSDGVSLSPRKSASKWRDVLCIGIAQSFALLPGISRSGSTLSVARLLGWRWEDAIRFSFLLAIPAILGGTLLELAQCDHAEIPWRSCWLGFGASFFSGVGAIHFLLTRFSPGMVRIFGWYCLVVGVLSLVRLCGHP